MAGDDVARPKEQTMPDPADNTRLASVLKKTWTVLGVVLVIAIFGTMLFGIFGGFQSRSVEITIRPSLDEETVSVELLLGADELKNCIVRGTVNYKGKQGFESQDSLFDLIPQWKRGQSVNINVKHTSSNALGHPPIERIFVEIEADSSQGKCRGVAFWDAK
jgi:hypothetical protein